MKKYIRIYVVKETNVLKNPKKSASKWAFSRTTLVEGLAIMKIKNNNMMLFGINEPSATVATMYVKFGMEEVQILLKAMMSDEWGKNCFKERLEKKCKDMEWELEYIATCMKAMGGVVKLGRYCEKVEALNLLMRSLIDIGHFLFQSDETIESFMKTDVNIVLRFFEEKEYMDLLLSYLMRAKAITTNILHNLKKEKLYLDSDWLSSLDEHGNKLIGYGMSVMVRSAIIFEEKQGGSDITLVLHPKTASFLPRYLNTYLADINPKIIAVENNLFHTAMVQ